MTNLLQGINAGLANKWGRTLFVISFVSKVAFPLLSCNIGPEFKGEEPKKVLDICETFRGFERKIPNEFNGFEKDFKLTFDSQSLKERPPFSYPKYIIPSDKSPEKLGLERGKNYRFTEGKYEECAKSEKGYITKAEQKALEDVLRKESK